MQAIERSAEKLANDRLDRRGPRDPRQLVEIPLNNSRRAVVGHEMSIPNCGILPSFPASGSKIVSSVVGIALCGAAAWLSEVDGCLRRSRAKESQPEKLMSL